MAGGRRPRGARVPLGTWLLAWLPGALDRGSGARGRRAPESARMKVRDVVRILEDHGYRLKRWTGSHRQFEGVVGGQRHLVTVAGKESDEGTATDARVHCAAVRAGSAGVPRVSQEGATTCDSSRNEREWRSPAPLRPWSQVDTANDARRRQGARRARKRPRSSAGNSATRSRYMSMQVSSDATTPWSDSPSTAMSRSVQMACHRPARL